jgi:serine/threonine-protein kinase
VHLIDFGIALSNINPRNTRFHVVKGKLDFLSPEQATASPRIDQKTDIYSAGLLLYLLLAAHNPLDGEENTALERARNPTIPRIDSLVTIPVELTQLVHSMLSPIPDERPGDAGATARGLLALLHRLEPGFDEIAFADSIRERLADEIQAEEAFLNGMGEGTQIIRTGDLPQDALQSGEFQPKPSAQSHDDLNAKARRDETTPIVAADDIIKSAIPEEKRSSGREQTKDDLQAILAELEDIYDD